MEIRKIQQRKPRIAMIMDTWFPVHTGEQVYTAQLMDTLVHHGYEVDLFTRAIAGKLTAEQESFEAHEAIRVRRFGIFSHPWNWLMQLWFVLRAAGALVWRGQRYQLYHAHTATSALAMKLASWFTGVPTVLTVHANHVFERSWTLRKIVHRIMFTELRYAQEVSISEDFLRAKNVNESVLVVPYGVDTAPFDALPSNKDREQFRALYVGRLDFSKGLDVLLKAVHKVIASTGFIQSHKDFQLHLVGRGPDREALEKKAEQLGIRKYIKFHGLLDRQAVMALYKACDLFVLPSRMEALPFALLEAAAAKLPLLATHVGDVRKIVVDQVNGHTVEPDDVEELAYYLEHFTTNPHLEHFGQASYDLVAQEFSAFRSMEKMLRIYEHTIEKKNAARMAIKEHLLSSFGLLRALWRVRSLRKSPRRSKMPLRFCMTVNLLDPAPERLAHEASPILPFLERFTEWSAQWNMPCTLFFQNNLLSDFSEEISALVEGGHEVGVRFTEGDWLSFPLRKKALRGAREWASSADVSLKMLRAPLELDEDDLELAHENGFEFLPVSEDPDPELVWKWGLPRGRILRFNIENWLGRSDEWILAAVQRLQNYQRQAGLQAFLIFEWTSPDAVNGEAFTELGKKLAMLQTHIDLEFMTLSDFCASCKV